MPSAFNLTDWTKIDGMFPKGFDFFARIYVG